MFRIHLARSRMGHSLAIPALVVVLTAAIATAGASARSAQGPPVVRANELMHGPVWARDNANAGKGRGGGGNALMTWHGGDVMTSAAVKAVFWGPKWGSSSFAADKISGLDSFYAGVGGTSYMGTNTEYTGLGGEQVTTTVSYAGHAFDSSATPRSAPSTSAVLAAVSRVVTDPVANGYYPVYTDIPRGHAGYCAWHSYGFIGNTPVQFGFFFSLDNDPGCDPKDTSGLHSQGLAALANVSGHELSEAVTDPRNGGWYDGQGAENADKCAWTWGGLVTFSDRTQWKIQGNFSNAAYTARTGYDGAGCISH
jgi:hypothetical protein